MKPSSPDTDLTLELEFESAGELLTSWARHVAEGGLELEPESTFDGERELVIVTPHRRFDGNVARCVDDRLEVTAGQSLNAFFTETRSHGAPFDAPPAPAREFRFPVDAASHQRLGNLWRGGLSSGALFLETPLLPAPQTPVSLELSLPGDERVVLDAVVVHVVEAGHRPGIGVQLTGEIGSVLAHLNALLDAPRRQPRVLVIDDEALWRSTYSRLLRPMGADVILASDGKRGLELLIEHFFEIDLVVLDLHMPELDGRALIDRVRRLGGESGLRLFLVSAAPEEELEEFVRPDGATRVFSKLQAISELEAILAEALELQPLSVAA